jgi:Tol biopolymer transport system component
MSLVPGARLGRYEVIAVIGAGGMGEVYRARDTRLDRDVAIKVLPAAFAQDDDRLSRFEREAKAVAALSHPNILAIHDTGTHDGQMFVVTELLEGETLRERLAPAAAATRESVSRGAAASGGGAARPTRNEGALPVRKATEIAVQIVRGLAAAHDKGILHRDLKPENVFLLRDGQVKILDFGLARSLDTGTGATETLAAVTDPGAVMGTVGYMAPEQARGQATDARTDLFALGALLYEMLSGQRAFKGDTTADTMFAIVKEDPPDLAGLRPDVPLALQRIVRHCLEKNPAERFQSAHDVAFALESSSDSGATTLNVPLLGGAARTMRGPRSRALAGVAIGVTVVLTIWLVVWRTGSSRHAAGDVAAMPIVIGTATQLTADDGLEIDPAISPDGKLLAYAAGKATQMRIFIRPVTGGRTIALSEDREPFEFQPRWSPDGNQILYLTRDGAFVASALGGTSRRIVPGAIGAAAWSPDGKQLLVARGRTASVAQVDGSGERAIGSSSDDLYACDWSPQGDWIACASGNPASVVPGPTFGNVAPSALVLAPTAGGRFTEATDRTALNGSPVWSPDGRQLYFVSNRQGPRDIYVMDIAEDGRVRGEPRRVSTGLGAQSIAFSATAQRLVYVAYAARANIWSLPIPLSSAVESSGARALTSGNQIVESMHVSRDGQWLLYDSTLHLNADAFRLPLAGGEAQRLTTDPADDFAPDLSPDGREVAYHSWRSGSRDIFIRTVDGGPLQQVTATAGQESYPMWSPDGRALAFVDQFSEAGMSRGLFVIRRDASGNWGPLVALRKGVRPIGSWLPDGHSLAYARAGALEIIAADSGSARVAYAPAPGSPDPAVESVAVSEDGRTVYFKSHDTQGRASIWAVSVAGGRPRPLVRFSDLSRVSIRPDFAAGAGRLFFTLEDRQADIWMADITRR